jgi:hypothetical protein
MYLIEIDTLLLPNCQLFFNPLFLILKNAAVMRDSLARFHDRIDHLVQSIDSKKASFTPSNN